MPAPLTLLPCSYSLRTDGPIPCSIKHKMRCQPCRLFGFITRLDLSGKISWSDAVVHQNKLFVAVKIHLVHTLVLLVPARH